MKTPTYRITYKPDDNGTLLVTCDAFPEVTTYGEDVPRVWQNALGAIEEAIAARISDGREIPPSTAKRRYTGVNDASVPLPTQTALKVLLYQLLRKSGMSRAELARRLGAHREQVDRLFRLDHASRIDKIEAAYKVLNQEIQIEVKERTLAH